MSIASLLLATSAFGASLTLNPGDDVATLTSSLGPGDEITFNAGVYPLDAGLTWEGIGAEDAPIVMRANGDVTLELAAGGQVARIINSSYIEVRGLTFKGLQEHYDANNYTGLRVQDSDHVVVDGNTFDMIGDIAVYLAGQTNNITVSNNHISNVRNDGIYAGCFDASCWSQDSTITMNWIHDIENGDGIEFGNGNQNVTVSHNVLYNIGDDGIQARSAEYGVPNTITGNVIWNADGGLVLTGAATVQNNVIFNITTIGIYTENERDTLQDLRISHNTIYNTGDWGVEITEWATLEGMVFCNNAITNTTGAALRAANVQVDDANLFSNNVITGFINSDYLDPLLGHYMPGAGGLDYEDPVAWNYYPSIDSTLLNAASTDGACYIPELDFNGLPRDGDAPEVGAYEHVYFNNPGWLIREGHKELTDDVPISVEVGDGCCSKDNAESLESSAFLLPLVFLGWRRRRRRE